MPAYLVVDDSPTVRLSLSHAIRRARGGDPQVFEASTADEAMDVFHKHEVEVVFLDMMLAKGPQGLDAMRLMLSLRPDARIALVTALPREHPDVVAAVSLGAFAHVAKPVRMEAVREILDQIDVEEGRTGRIR